jgi:hypothetical protein
VSNSERRWAWPALAGVLVAATLLRVWGIAQGLPFVYNLDEADHFVPRAVAMFRHGSLNPHYFANPPALTYLLHVVFAVWFGGSAGVQHAYAHDPRQVYVLARAVTAALGVLAVWLLYLLGARLVGRACGLLAAAIEAFAFLPVFYAHLALNDVPTLAPLTLSLVGSAGVLRRGRRRDYLLAGVGLGLACATKYTAGIALLPLLAAAIARRRANAADDAAQPAAESRGPTIAVGLALAAGVAVAAFLIANPYSLLDLHAFEHELTRQSSLAGEAQGKLGAPRDGGLLYYLWSLTWGLGWVPTVAAAAGAVLAFRRERALGWVLVPAPVLFLLFMGVQGRYFGRWLMPVFPLLCLLAAIAGVCAVAAIGRRRSYLRVPAAVLVVAALVGQGLLHSVHAGRVLARADTRAQARTWMLANVPAGSGVVVEPVVPNAWLQEPGGEDRWRKFPALTLSVDPATGAPVQGRVRVRAEDYVRTLSPALLDYYVRHGYCWVLTGSTESGRALADPGKVPAAVAYYRKLAETGRVVFRASPYAAGRGPVPFGFDWSFDYYPLAFARPGPVVTIYRLTGGACGR